MAKKSKGRQRITMAKMENESNLQVTFSKRRSGLFKKASELNTLCGADIAIVVFSPGGKVYSFGHPSVEIVLNRFKNINQPTLNQNNNMRLNEARPNDAIRVMNDFLTQVMNDLELAKKKNEELKKMRKNSKMPVNWWEDPVEELDLAHAKEFKSLLEKLKSYVTEEASKHFQAIFPQPNFYGGSSSGAPFRDGGYISPNLDPSERRMFNMNAYYNQNMYPPNYPLPYGNNNYAGGFVPEYNLNYMHGFNQYRNQNQNLSFKEEGISENECHQDGPPPHL
ncbi:hypothetical protein IGI04_040993 [Brassica rapa subsp. trilocularis]|uniref:MADS-box domain-containing protein n=3 Tax=Brassica TaxID=3705 RepID=A0ABQ8BQ10_BRANA|nr:agamous-like MADS-box protein AGL62 [Brassica rapa]XP_013666237.2 agamous-like MADS-box protein AGL62 [Brassica napus]KAG5376397.1 hypothetical protein IGI04_040993 [Brassica rapa subsp. trilocularis]KAH0906872.1 hypothetical protein HID58_038699 [Brassica napus]CAG7910605.1 unnamed protein product [Brassica rapa]